MANNKAERIFRVVVVGMSGTTETRGDFGVGKSCLCNRFVNPHEDEYYPQHISMISQCDFSGRIINNDHFLYWGELVKRFDGMNFHFRIVEQTEFIDDTSFSVLKGSVSKNYIKRCADTKLSSAEKVAYVCPDQLGDEGSFPQDALPGGKFQVDGYLLVFDVSNVKGRNVNKQMEFVQKLHSSISKTKKPIVIVATKFDAVEETSLSSLRQFAREKKLSIVECSSQLNINVNLPFCTLAAMIDKNRSKPREMSYQEAFRRREERVAAAKKKYTNLLESRVTDYRSIWSNTKAELEKLEDYLGHVVIAGTKSAKKLFRNHTKRLKEDHQQHKQNMYLANMPSMLMEIYPDLEAINGRYWPACRDALESSPHFDKWFIKLDQPWEDSEYIDTDELRIPFQLMTEPGLTARVEIYFQDHVHSLQEAKRKERYKSDFRTMLGNLRSIILPGSNFHEMRLNLENLECYQNLDEPERMAVFIAHQNEIFQQAREDLLELLLEKSDLFIKLDKSGKVLEQVNSLQDELSSDPRFMRLCKFPSERYVMIIKQFAFMHNLVTNSCYMHKQEQCVEAQIREHAAVKLQRCNTLPIKLLLLGTDGLAVELAKEIRDLCKGGFQLNDTPMEIETEILDQKALTTDIQRRSFNFDGCISVFTSLQSFEYIKTTLELTKVQEAEEAAKVLQHIPVALMFGRDSSIPESDSALRDEAQGLAERIPDCSVVDLPEDGISPGRKFFPNQIISSVNSLNEMSTFRVALVMMCGDLYSLEPTLGYLMKEHNCQLKSTSEFCVVMEMTFEGRKQRLELEVVSYHQAQLNCKSLHHAYILCYSQSRKSSLQIMKTFSYRISGIPALIVAISNDSYNSNSTLLDEGRKFAEKSESLEFLQARPNFLQQNLMSRKNRFLDVAFTRRKSTEKVHHDLFFADSITPSSDDEEYSDTTPDNELDDDFEMVPAFDQGSQGSSASRDDITSATEASSIGEGEDIGKRKSEMLKKQRLIGRKLGDKKKEERFLQSLEQLMGETTADSKNQKQTTADEPQRKWWFKTRKPKGHLRGLMVEDISFGTADVPPFVEQCVSIIEEKGLTIEGIYRKPGKAVDVEDVINKVDKDPNFPIGSLSINVHAVASAFKQFFHALSGPFIPYKVQTDLIKKFNDLPQNDFIDHLKTCINALSHKRYTLLKYILLHLKRIIDNSDTNKMSYDNVSICWWPCLLHPQSKSVKDLTNESKLASIFTLLLQNMEFILDLPVEEAKEAEEEGEEEEEEAEDQTGADEDGGGDGE
ncbi:rho GTPase-activating protein 35-like isoform X2 [Apostichopus japonicus]|uniref:rho GTPase-activating protein 35-like isoform X2 n=1 Tax=Stichopus japonicus TaxID=307972 RepID=UPI003AB250A7